jgi:hypothetical protein
VTAVTYAFSSVLSGVFIVLGRTEGGLAYASETMELFIAVSALFGLPLLALSLPFGALAGWGFYALHLSRAPAEPA